MARKLRPLPPDALRNIARARARVLDAILFLQAAECPRAETRARALLKSLDGAYRHAERRGRGAQPATGA